MYHWPAFSFFFFFFPGSSHSSGERGWEGSHLLALPLRYLPTSVPDGHLLGMLKFNADERWLTSWGINVRAGGAQGGEIWSSPLESWMVGWQFMCLRADNNGWDCNTRKIRFDRPHAAVEVCIPHYRLIWGWFAAWQSCVMLSAD